MHRIDLQISKNQTVQTKSNPHQKSGQDLKKLLKEVAPYRGADTWRSVRQLTLTSGLFSLSWLTMFLVYEVSYWLTLLLAVPTQLR